VAPRATCAGSPAANAGYDTFGYPCFRQGALPVILLATDEQPLSPGDTNKCPSWSTVVQPQMASRSARLIGNYGSSPAGGTISDLQVMATMTGAVKNGNAPLVFDGADANAAVAIENGVRTLANGVPLDLSALLADDPSDAIDAVGALLDHQETLQLGTPECTDMLDAVDTNADTLPDSYVDVLPGTGVCWRLSAKSNDIIPATDTPRLLRASIQVVGDGVATLDTRDVYLLVPAVPEPASGVQLLASAGALLAVARLRRDRSSEKAVGCC
jgi:hypothetical protein